MCLWHRKHFVPSKGTKETQNNWIQIGSRDEYKRHDFAETGEQNLRVVWGKCCSVYES